MAVVVLDLVVVVVVPDFCSVNKLLVHQHNLFYTQMYEVLVLHYPHSHHYNQFDNGYLVVLVVVVVMIRFPCPTSSAANVYMVVVLPPAPTMEMRG